MDDDVVTGNPVNGGGDLVLVTSLQGVDDTQHLVGVAAGRGRVGEDGANDLLGIDEEDGADGESNALLVDVGSILVVDPGGYPSAFEFRGKPAGTRVLVGFDSHIVQQGNLALLVTNDGERNVAASDLGNVLDPSLVGLDRVGRQADELDAALGELGLELGEGTQLGGADGGEVLGVGEEDNPVVANELVEVDGALGRLGLEVGRGGAEAEGSVGAGGHGCYVF